MITSVNTDTEPIIPAVVMRFALLDHAGALLTHERVNWCLKRIVPVETTVEIHKVRGGERAIYKNLMVCGSVWHCPICSQRITEERRIELSHAIKNWGGSLVMVTYTMRHNRQQSLETLLNALRAAYRRTKSGRRFQELRSRWGWKGSVRSLEVTYGANGWHVHIHELVFMEARRLTDYRIDAVKEGIFTLWANGLQRERMDADIVHGVHVETANSKIRDYIAKWGHEPISTGWDASHEITKQPTKNAKIGGLSPLALLNASYAGNRRKTALWLEYATNFKGVNQLVWSRGCRAMLGLGTEQPDIEVAGIVPSEFEPFITLTRRDWIAVKMTRRRGELLHYAAKHDAIETRTLIDEISAEYWR